jgi:hypothetical protein
MKRDVTLPPAGPDLNEFSDDELAEERDFLLQSLRDLEAERDAGDVEDGDYDVLKEGYTARAAAVLRVQEARARGADLEVRPEPPRPWWRRRRTVVVGAVVGVFAVGAGLLVAHNAGQRLPGDTLSGSVPNNKVDQLLVQAGNDVQARDIKGALKAYHDALQLDPHNVPALANQGWLVAILGNTANDRGLMDQGLAERAGHERPLLLCSPESTGAHAGVWCSHGLAPDEPGDQRKEDAKSLVFDTEPLPARLEILGAPIVELEVSADRPEAKLAVRLCDVHADGASTRVSYGILNLTHRESHEHPKPLEPGRRYKVRVQLNDIGYAFPPGHRVRVAVSSTYWPITWPTRERVAVTLFGGASSILLPVRAPKPADEALAPLPPVQSAPPEKRTVLRAGRTERRIERDIATGETIHRLVDDAGDVRIDAHRLEVGSVKLTEYRIKDDDPLTAVAEARWSQRVGRGAWRTRTETWTRMTATPDAFLLHATLDAYEGETRVWSQNWDCAVPRDLV